MKALIWKECRESLKWAALPILLLGAPMVLFGPPSIMNDDYLARLSLVAGVFGAALGFLQVFFESHGDRRALLLHRPISHSRIFVSKAIVGVGLYLLAMALPLAFVVAWTATPGKVPAPFSWQMTLPWVADILAGVVYYFAGMLAAQREARWYGSRALALAAALLCSLLVWGLPEFWQALLAIFVLGGIVALAAWGSFISGGPYAAQPPLAKAALATTFLAGLLGLGVAGKAAIGAWLDPGTNYRYELDRQGRLLLVHQEYNTLKGVTDEQGHELQELQGKWLDHSALKEIAAPKCGLSSHKVNSYRNTGRLFIPYRNDSSSEAEVWCYVPAQGRLLGYDWKSKRMIGSFGPDGFFPPDQQQKERFWGEPSYPSRFFQAGTAEYLDFPDGVYAIDFTQRKLQALFTPDQGETVLGAARWKDEKNKSSLAFVLTDKSVHVVDEQGTRLLSTPLAYDLETYGGLAAGRLENPQRYFFWYQPSWQLGPQANQTMPSHLVEYDTAGRQIAYRTVPPRPVASPSSAQALYGLASPPGEIALLAGTAGYFYSQARLNQGKEHNLLFYFLVRGSEHFIPGVAWDTGRDDGVLFGFAAWSLLSAAVGALSCLVLAHRSALPRSGQIGWSLCGLVFGPIGVLLMLALREWPARIACPGCHKPRVATRNTCEHCGAPHAKPQTDGTEIFEEEVNLLQTWGA